jgi:hypothetical protein
MWTWTADLHCCAGPSVQLPIITLEDIVRRNQLTPCMAAGLILPLFLTWDLLPCHIVVLSLQCFMTLATSLLLRLLCGDWGPVSIQTVPLPTVLVYLFTNVKTLVVAMKLLWVCASLYLFHLQSAPEDHLIEWVYESLMCLTLLSIQLWVYIWVLNAYM